MISISSLNVAADPASGPSRGGAPGWGGVEVPGWAGRVDDEELAALYRGARCLVFPSLYEGFGLPVIEAMACGTPVVTSRGGATEEVAGGAALLVAPGDGDALTDALAHLLGDESARRTLSEAGRARAATMTWEATGRATLAAYRELV